MSIRDSIGRSLEKLSKNLRRIDRRRNRIWIDVGSHLGEYTISFAREDPSITVFAFEPNLKQASQCFGLLPNFVVIPMAVEEHQGCADFYINAFEAASSLYPMNETARQQWIGGEQLKVVQKISVPVIRLDTFMNLLEIRKVEFLKIDAQGADFSVVKSAGDRLKDIDKIALEVAVTPSQLYSGASSKDEITDYLKEAGFKLVETEKQSSDQEENLTFIRK